MAKARGDFTDILVRRQILSPDQLGEPMRHSTAAIRN